MRRLMFNLKLKLRSFICKVKASMIHALGGVTELESAQMAMKDPYTRRDIQIKTARYTRDTLNISECTHRVRSENT